MPVLFSAWQTVLLGLKDTLSPVACQRAKNNKRGFCFSLSGTVSLMQTRSSELHCIVFFSVSEVP